MDFFINAFQTTITTISIDRIVFLLHDTPFTYIITLALFCCIFLLISVFSAYKVLNLKILVAWIFACIANFMYLINGYKDMEFTQFNTALHSQIILSFASITILTVFYILGLINTKPYKKRKNFGRHTWWVNIVRFIVLFAFCCAFNIGLFVASALFYL